MTCFWTSILRSLKPEDFKIIGENHTRNPPDFIHLLKKHNKPIIKVLWQGQAISEKEKKEHFQAVKDYNIRGIGQGHWTGSCDSFLLLISELFRVDIIHNNIGTRIHYKHPESRKTLNFHSNRGHFSHG